MSELEQVSAVKCFGGMQGVYRHLSAETKTPMRFGVFLPPQATHAKAPVLWFLAGLTCTEENFITKAGAQRVASELGLIMVSPDTSPRGEDVPDDPDKAYDFGLAAGFYLDATQPPWSTHYRMGSYIANELPAIIAANFPSDMERQGISGHSMGGHGALTISLRHPDRFRSVSAFAPITSAMNCPWGVKALSNYLGDDPEAWRRHDATALIEDGARLPGDILIDQGGADPYLRKELKPELLEAACAERGQGLILRRQPGYDHSYFFVSTFIEDHLRWHAERLT